MPRILIVDNVRGDRLAIRTILRDGQLDFVEADNGQQALEQLERTAPDLVVTDLSTPIEGGLELVSIARQRCPNVPVVVITSPGNEDIARQALQLGAASYVPKDELRNHLPPTVDRLLELVGTHATQKRLLRRLLNTQFCFELDNDPTYLPPLINFLQESLNQIGTCSPADVTRVSVALDEALTNAMFHGNLELNSDLRVGDEMTFYKLVRQRQSTPPFNDRRVRVDVDLRIEEARFVITDEGPGFDVSGLPDPDDNQSLDKLSGRGVMLMQMFMDEVCYNEVGNAVTMVKRRSCNGDGREPTAQP